ncbi:MAG: glycine rich domain-containing protein [Candidatus Daviesbacteria bacterium]|nr:glycine rich domain-containing protein [Candidatus Daviesbacteria bacterium]
MMGIRIKQLELRIKVFLSFFILALFFTATAGAVLILYSLFYHPTFAQVQSCGSVTTQPRAQGLVSTQTVTGKFYTSSGGCIVDERASFVSFRIPDYDRLKSLYFTQAKESGALKKIAITGNATQGSLSLTTNTAAHISGNMSLSGNISGSATGIIFIDGKLDITQNFAYGGGNYGVVLVVKGNVVIAPTVNTVNAVIISEGVIYTAGEFCSTSSTNAPQLTINGSLISLNPDSRIRFCRNLTDNSLPAEIINHQPKYVVILRNIFSEKFRKFSEITGTALPATSPSPTTPTPTPTSTPTPTPTPTSTPTPAPTSTPTNCSDNAGVVTCNYAGTQQTWVVPTGVTSISVDAKGAQGSNGNRGAIGGKGARVIATISVTAGETLYIYVGGQSLGRSGGYNGGMTGGTDPSSDLAGGGGGASDIRKGGTAINNRVVIAGGGGGGGSECSACLNRGGSGGAGGDPLGKIGSNGAGTYRGYGGGGGTMTGGGSGGASGGGASTAGFSPVSAGSGGTGGNGAGNGGGGGGGGGGYYGGGGGGGGDNAGSAAGGGGGGGGSSYGDTFTSGYQSGNGQIIITY